MLLTRSPTGSVSAFPNWQIAPLGLRYRYVNWTELSISARRHLRIFWTLNLSKAAQCESRDAFEPFGGGAAASGDLDPHERRLQEFRRGPHIKIGGHLALGFGFGNPSFERGPERSAGGLIQQHHLRIGSTELADRTDPHTAEFRLRRRSRRKGDQGRFQSFEWGGRPVQASDDIRDAVRVVLLKGIQIEPSFVAERVVHALSVDPHRLEERIR